MNFMATARVATTILMAESACQAVGIVVATLAVAMLSATNA